MTPVVTLTTEFQEQNPPVAILKGVLLTRCPGVQIIDLSHDIPLGDVMGGALFLASAVPHFPDGTVHLVDVAPGPTPIALSIKNQFVVCPDNGITSILLERYPHEAAYAIAPPSSNRAGQTIFGRDIFAPTAARLAAGTPIAEVGEPLEALTCLELPKPRRAKDRTIEGEIIHIDRFGNLITNIHSSFLGEDRVTEVSAGTLPLRGICGSYGDVPAGSPLAIFGSDGFLEVAYNGDRADQRLQLSKGILVRVTLGEEQ
jgi:S-adenosylmethionine hydrolase